MKVFRSIRRSAGSLHCKGGAARRFLNSEFGIRNSEFAFTLVELLVVISLMGLIAGLAVPAIKTLGKSNAQTSASRQLLDDIGRARQLAISQHTTVYMVFVPSNFFNLACVYKNSNYPDLITGINAMTPVADQRTAMNTVSNLVEMQLSGYNYVSLGQVGDQPGQHTWHYLSTWQSLPEGTFIAPPKFQPAYSFTPMQIPAWQFDYPNAGQIDLWRKSGNAFMPQIYAFTNCGVYIPFPTEKSPGVLMPCLAFDSTGKLVSEFDGFNYHHAYIPLAQGIVAYGRDLKKQPALTVVKPTDITENPAGNSTSVSYNVIDVDPLSGRTKLLVHHLP